jgi:hypothetical protein
MKESSTDHGLAERVAEVVGYIKIYYYEVY